MKSIKEKSHTWLAWLEKQEQKEYGWSEESDDDAWLNDIVSKVESDLQLNKAEINWLKSIKGKLHKEIHYWTEEEIEPIISDYLRGTEHYGGMIGRLRCLKPKHLERQGEQEAWSEEDKNMLEWVIEYLNNRMLNTPISEERTACKNAIAWLKSLKDRVQPQQESDERNKLLGKLEEWFDEYVSDLADVDTATLISSFTNYLDGKLPKSLRHQNTWKPSEEQMYNLSEAAHYNCAFFDMEILKGLYDDLKQL